MYRGHSDPWAESYLMSACREDRAFSNYTFSRHGVQSASPTSHPRVTFFFFSNLNRQFLFFSPRNSFFLFVSKFFITDFYISVFLIKSEVERHRFTFLAQRRSKPRQKSFIENFHNVVNGFYHKTQNCSARKSKTGSPVATRS